jgi:two-component system C4-dicarboxylate transport response regulator DctD
MSGGRLDRSCLVTIVRAGAGLFRLVNCPAIPASLFESELFGHEKGAFIGRRQKALSRCVERIPRGTMDALAACSWPENVRELESVIERALILSPGHSLTKSAAAPKARRAPEPSMGQRPCRLSPST